MNIILRSHTIIGTLCDNVAYGAKIIEKHFTLDKNYSNFRDHKLSAETFLQ